jgi:hypothetical protein
MKFVQQLAALKVTINTNYAIVRCAGGGNRTHGLATFRRKKINEKCGKSGDFVFEISSSC